MKVGTRIIFTIFLILVFGACVMIACAAFGAFPEADVEGVLYGFTSSSYKYVWAGAAIVVGIVAIALMFFGKKDADKLPPSVTIFENEDGSICITSEAIDELVKRYLNEVGGMVVQRTRIIPQEGKCVRIDVYMSVRRDVVIPDLTKKVIEGMKCYIDKYAGLDASYVGIKILPMKQNQSPVK